MQPFSCLGGPHPALSTRQLTPQHRGPAARPMRDVVRQVMVLASVGFSMADPVRRNYYSLTLLRGSRRLGPSDATSRSNVLHHARIQT